MLTRAAENVAYPPFRAFTPVSAMTTIYRSRSERLLPRRDRSAGKKRVPGPCDGEYAAADQPVDECSWTWRRPIFLWDCSSFAVGMSPLLTTTIPTGCR